MTINLQKGQKISLDKDGSQLHGRVIMGLGWDAKTKKGLFSFLSSSEIDLDASCVVMDTTGKMIDAVWFEQLKSLDGSIEHTGDNVTGQGEGDDEQIKIDLAKVPPHVQSLVFVVNSFSGETFERIANAYCRLVDQASGQEVARYQLNCPGRHTAMVMAKIYRHQGKWGMHAIGENAVGKTFHELLPVITANI
ncbi:MAG: TerD family protein [Magnetococcales bacterium]|nr:TerD family protein [Magnetococcales bacterium]